MYETNRMPKRSAHIILTIRLYVNCIIKIFNSKNLDLVSGYFGFGFKFQNPKFVAFQCLMTSKNYFEKIYIRLNFLLIK